MGRKKIYKGNKVERSRAAAKAWYYRNKKPGKVFYTPEEKKEAQAKAHLKWRSKPGNHETLMKSVRRWQKTPQGKLCKKKHNKIWRLNHPDNVLNYQRVWQKNNPDKVKAIKQRYLERKRNGLV
jgi:hypothetical protein